MTQNYQKIGDYISVVDNRNIDGNITNLMGISIDKCYIPSVANVIGTDLHNYKVIRKGQFACSLMQVSRDQRIPLAMYTSEEPAIMSPAYVMFEVNCLDKLLPEYLELWFKRAEFDREASFYAVGGVRGSLDWEDFCKMKLPIPSLPEQRKIVHDYQVITDRIELLRKMNENCHSMTRCLYKANILDKAAINISSGRWTERNLIKVCNVVYGKGLATTDLTDDGFPVYGGNGKIGYYKSYIYQEPQIIISCRGVASGKVHHTVPFSYVTSNSLVLEINNITETPFELVLFNALFTDFESKVTGSAQPQLTKDGLKDVKFCVPDASTTKQFCDTVRPLLSVIKNNEEEIDILCGLQTQMLCHMSDRRNA